MWGNKPGTGAAVYNEMWAKSSAPLLLPNLAFPTVPFIMKPAPSTETEDVNIFNLRQSRLILYIKFCPSRFLDSS